MAQSPLSPLLWGVKSSAALPACAGSPSMRVHMLAVETTLLPSCMLRKLSSVLDRGRDCGQGIMSQGGQQRQNTGLPIVFTDMRPGTGTSWPLPASSSGSYSKHKPVMLVMWPASSSLVLCSGQVAAQECKQDRRPLMEASILYGDKHPKPRFHSQASGYL